MRLVSHSELRYLVCQDLQQVNHEDKRRRTSKKLTGVILSTSAGSPSL